MKEKKSLACGGIVAHYGSLFQLQYYELSLSHTHNCGFQCHGVVVHTIYYNFNYNDLSLIMFSLFLKKQLLFELWIFYDCKKIYIKQEKPIVVSDDQEYWWVCVGADVVAGSLCTTDDCTAVRHYGKTKPFFVLSCFCVLKLDWFDSLSLSPMVGSHSFYAFMTVTSEFFSRSRVHDFIFSSSNLINIFSTLSFDEFHEMIKF